MNAHDPIRKVGPLDCLIGCEDCGAVNLPKHPEGRLPVLVGHRRRRGEDETFVLRVEFPMKLPSSKRSYSGPPTVVVDDEAALMRFADEALTSIRSLTPNDPWSHIFRRPGCGW